MPTYVYEVLRPDGTAGERFEVIQQLREPPLQTHPVSGEAVRRVITTVHVGKLMKRAIRRSLESMSNIYKILQETFQGIKLVVDCANGAAYHIAPSVFAELGAEVVSIAADPNGFNINDGCGSTQPVGLQEAVVREGADLGVALDGDGDRAILVDANGGLVDGDKLLFILARERHRSGTMVGGVVGTLMTNLGLEHALEKLDIGFSRASVGDRYVMTRMLEKGWELGGETSGHIICLDKCTTGDGIIASLQVIQAMVRNQRSLEELADGMSVYPQTMLNVPLPGSNGNGRFDAFANRSISAAVKEAETMLGDNGRVVLRPSGTEPVVRVMVEGVDAELVDRLTTQLAEVVRAEAAH